MGTIAVGADLAKHLFSVCEMDGAGHVSRRRELRRDAFALWLAQLAAGTLARWRRAAERTIGHGAA